MSRIIGPIRQVGHIVRDCRPVMAVIDDEQWAPWIATADARCVVMTVDDVAAFEGAAGETAVIDRG